MALVKIFRGSAFGFPGPECLHGRRLRHCWNCCQFDNLPETVHRLTALYSMSGRMVQMAVGLFRRLAAPCQQDVLRSPVLPRGRRRFADSCHLRNRPAVQLYLRQNFAGNGLCSFFVRAYYAAAFTRRWLKFSRWLHLRFDCNSTAPRRTIRRPTSRPGCCTAAWINK